MSGPAERKAHLLLRGLISLLLAAGAGLPALFGLGAGFLLPGFALYSLAVAAACTLLRMRKRLLGAGVCLFLLSQAALLSMGRGYFRGTWTLLQAGLLAIQGTMLPLTMQSGALCLHLAVALTLLFFLLSAPDMGVSLQCSLVLLALGAYWALGLRAQLLWMLPALPGLALLHAYAHSYESEALSQGRLPSAWLLPAAALLAALALALTPAEGTRSPALSRLAEELREAINDRFFFQQERARYTLADDGWMPQGERRLGGPAEPDEHLVMEVETDEVIYLRGAILDSYTGAAWYDSVSARRYYWNAAGSRALRDAVTQATLPLAASLPEKQVTVRFLSSGASTLFVPQRLRSLTAGERMTPYFNLGSEVFITRNLAYGDAYSASYVSLNATDSGMAALAAANAKLDDPGYAEAVRAYTVLPSHIQQEVRDIADAVTANCETDWQRACALRDYLRQHYGYTLDTQIPPADVDFVAWFLLAEREGYCTYFASAMTVLCRMAGLPARYIEGYLVRPEADGVTAVHGTDAHAWTEVYLNGLGWVTFDATPGHGDTDRSGSEPPPAAGGTPTPPPAQDTPTPTPDSQQPPETPTPPPEENAAQTPTPTPPDGGEDEPSPSPKPQDDPPAPPRGPSLPWLWLLLALALLCLLAARIRVTGPLYRAERAKDANEALLLLWQAILTEGACLKAPIRPAETPLAYGSRAEEALGVRLLPVAEAVSALRYGRRSAPRGAVKRAREVYSALNERLSPQQKLKLALLRALPHKHKE